jgi:hypothetical protein
MKAPITMRLKDLSILSIALPFLEAAARQRLQFSARWLSAIHIYFRRK